MRADAGHIVIAERRLDRIEVREGTAAAGHPRCRDLPECAPSSFWLYRRRGANVGSRAGNGAALDLIGLGPLAGDGAELDLLRQALLAGRERATAALGAGAPAGRSTT
jgi:hypothetical protein